jgi:hypothetical protein
MEFQAMTDAVKASSIHHYTCFAHQVNRSAKYASGTGYFKTPANTELAKVMKKMHEINGRVYRNETRLKVLFAVQTKKISELLLQASLFCLDRFCSSCLQQLLLHLIHRKVIRRPFRGVTTRWNSDHNEVKATNIFMGDLQKSLVLMLGDKGCDAALLKEKDKNGDPIDKMLLIFLPRDQSILCQYECASEPVV